LLQPEKKLMSVRLGSEILTRGFFLDYGYQDSPEFQTCAFSSRSCDIPHLKCPVLALNSQLTFFGSVG
jgi:hypothetical protein